MSIFHHKFIIRNNSRKSSAYIPYISTFPLGTQCSICMCTCIFRFPICAHFLQNLQFHTTWRPSCVEISHVHTQQKPGLIVSGESNLSGKISFIADETVYLWRNSTKSIWSYATGETKMRKGNNVKALLHKVSYILFREKTPRINGDTEESHL